MSTAAPLCSIVIPSYNGRALLQVCLGSIARHRPESIPIEIIVADDASTDDTPEWLARTYPDARLIRLEQNQGFCGAANAGLAAARGSYIQLLNNDTEVTAGWIEAGLTPFVNPHVGSVAPLVLVRSDPALVDSAGDRYALYGWPSKRGHGQSAEKWRQHPPDVVFGASGSSAFYRAEALAKVGGFDRTFGAYYEDVDLAFRLRWAGYDCVFTPHCQILHEVSASYDHARPALQRRMARNSEILFWSSLPAHWLTLAVVPHVMFTLLQASWRLARGRLGPFLGGKLDAIQELRHLRARRAARFDLGRKAVARPHFPITIASFEDARNHLTRPVEAFARLQRNS